MHSITDQIAALQRIAAFSCKGCADMSWECGAPLRDSALANCVHCGREIRVYCSPVQPDIDGSALEVGCVKNAAEAA